MTSVEDTGGIVRSVFQHPTEYIGRTVGVVGVDDTCAAYAKLMSQVFNQPVEYKYIPRDVYAGFGFPGAEELANMFEVQRLYISDRKMDLIESHGLNTEMQTFEKWLYKNKSLFDAQIAKLQANEEMAA